MGTLRLRERQKGKHLKLGEDDRVPDEDFPEKPDDDDLLMLREHMDQLDGDGDAAWSCHCFCEVNNENSETIDSCNCTIRA